MGPDLTFIALLRGINVGGRTRVAMTQLRAVCEAIGWREVRTYIQSGNVIFRAPPGRERLETQLEAVIPEALGIRSSVIVRSAEEWSRYRNDNPFPAESAKTPNLVMLALSKAPPARDALGTLRSRAGGEHVERVGDALWIHFPDGAGRSRLTSALIDDAVGSPTTMRNWRTVHKVGELAGV